MPFDSGLDRERLKEIRDRIAEDVTTRASPKEFLRQWSEVVDGLVRKAFQKAQSQGACPVCLVAVGGYGRSELAPCSDVDLLLLHAPSPQANLQRFIEQTLYPLWDLGLEVSCSSRSIPECLKMARSDLQVKTSLIDDRYLDGEYELFRNLHKLFVKKVLNRKVHEFAEALIKELHLCRQKYQDPAYVLEPNIKEGEGGLRDFQIGRWIIRAKYRTDRWDSIVFPDHSRNLDRSLQFLWALRNQLHLFSGRKQDVLTFELQERIAPILGFSTGTQGVEEMMRRYHLSTQLILNFVLGVLQRTRSKPSAIRKAYFHFKDSRIDARFRIRSGEISLVDPVTFKREASQLMVLFKHCQTLRVEMDYRTEEAVIEALPFVDNLFRQEEAVNRSFLGILSKGNWTQVVLRKMHELGFLSRYIPEFSTIEGRVHYDLYHVHPVDMHSILAVEELEKLREGAYRGEYSFLTSLVNEIDKPEVLFLAALLHDIGKGSEGDHSLVGAAMAEDIGSRMGLSVEEAELIHFLVRHHLFMLEIALRRDLRDEQAILRFAREVGNSNRLKMLYLLTFADVKAVGPEAWTSWKASLLMELFLKTFHLFERPEAVVPLSKSEEVVRKLEERLPNEVASQYAEHLPPRYLSCYSWQEICRHVEMASSLEREALLVRWSTEGERRAEITLCTNDRNGLFSKIAGSMFLNGISIFEAQIHTWANGVALDTFRVEDATGDVKHRLQQFERSLEAILNEKKSLKDLISQKTSQPYLRKVVPRVSAEVRINNADSDFYTIIEVTGEDRLGILYELTQALNDYGSNIHFARISTLGNRIIDVFYVQDAWGEKLEGKDQLDLLRQTLLDRFTPGTK